MPLFHVYKELKAVAICLLKFSPTVRIIHCLLSLLGLSYNFSSPTSSIAKANTERLTKLLEKLVLEHKETFDPDNIRDFLDASLQVRRDVTRYMLAYHTVCSDVSRRTWMGTRHASVQHILIVSFVVPARHIGETWTTSHGTRLHNVHGGRHYFCVKRHDVHHPVHDTPPTVSDAHAQGNQ